MSATIHESQAEHDQLLNACTPQEISQLHMPVRFSDFAAWGLPVPASSVPWPWRTRGEFMLSVFFDYEAASDFCWRNSTRGFLNMQPLWLRPDDN